MIFPPTDLVKLPTHSDSETPQLYRLTNARFQRVHFQNRKLPHPLFLRIVQGCFRHDNRQPTSGQIAPHRHQEHYQAIKNASPMTRLPMPSFGPIARHLECQRWSWQAWVCCSQNALRLIPAKGGQFFCHFREFMGKHCCCK